MRLFHLRLGSPASCSQLPATCAGRSLLARAAGCRLLAAANAKLSGMNHLTLRSEPTRLFSGTCGNAGLQLLCFQHLHNSRGYQFPASSFRALSERPAAGPHAIRYTLNAKLSGMNHLTLRSETTRFFSNTCAKAKLQLPCFQHLHNSRGYSQLPVPSFGRRLLSPAYQLPCATACVISSRWLWNERFFTALGSNYPGFAFSASE